MTPEILDVVLDYCKYLDCQECRKTGLYCRTHRAEVDQILAKCRSKAASTF